MRKLLLAAALALPCALLFTPKASAFGCGSCSCPPTPVHKFGVSLGIVFKPFWGSDCAMSKKPWQKPPCPRPGCYAGGCGGCGAGGYSGCGGSPIGCGYGPIGSGGYGGTLGPWYSYYPYAAHFQTPAPTGYPMWPSPQTSGPTPMFGYQVPNQMNYGYQAAPQVMPVGYYPTQGYPTQGFQAPSYWYGR